MPTHETNPADGDREPEFAVLKGLDPREYFHSFKPCLCCGVALRPNEECPCDVGICETCNDWMLRASGGAVTSDEYYRSKFSQEEWDDMFRSQNPENKDRRYPPPTDDDVPF